MDPIHHPSQENGTKKISPLNIFFVGVIVVVAIFGFIHLYRLNDAGVNVGNLVTAQTVPTSQSRPANWASSMPATPGLGNFYKVSDDLYRGEQPTDEGIASLKKLGIKTVICLRSMNEDKEEAAGQGLEYANIKCKASSIDDDEVVEFLKVVKDKSRGPFFVHCLHGSDRTGTMCAAYRVVIQGWSRQDAADEMTSGGYGFHAGYQNLVRYIDNMDVEKLKKLAGIK